MAKNRTYTGGKQCARPVTLNKSMYFQLIRKIRNAGKGADGERVPGRTPDNRTAVADVPEGLDQHIGDRKV